MTATTDFMAGIPKSEPKSYKAFTGGHQDLRQQKIQGRLEKSRPRLWVDTRIDLSPEREKHGTNAMTHMDTEGKKQDRKQTQIGSSSDMTKSGP